MKKRRYYYEQEGQSRPPTFWDGLVTRNRILPLVLALLSRNGEEESEAEDGRDEGEDELVNALLADALANVREDEDEEDWDEDEGDSNSNNDNGNSEQQ